MTDWYMKNLAWIRARDEELYYALIDMVEPRPQADWSAVEMMMRPKEWLFGLGPFSPSATILLYGFGDGEHVLYLMEKLAERGHLIVLIPDVPEFLELLHIVDMEAVLSDQRVHPVILNVNNDRLLRYMAGCYSPETIAFAKVFVLPDYDLLYPEGLTFLEQALEIVMQWMEG